MTDDPTRRETPPQVVRRADYAPPRHYVETVDLDFTLDELRTRVRAQMRIRRGPTADVNAQPMHLDGQALELVSVAIDGRPLGAERFVQDEAGLTIFNVPPAFTLDIETIINPCDNTKLEGLYLSNGTFCTQCEAEGFRHITYFPDRPDVMAVYTTTIRADRARVPVLLSNGNLVANGDDADGAHFAMWHDPFPKPSYLFALVAGDLAVAEDAFVTQSGRRVDLRLFVEHGNQGRCAFALDALKKAMRWDEQRYGREYDLDVFNIVAVSAFNMGAMENKSLNIFNDKYILADPETATDTDYAHIESVVAHEYFHNWTGNRVTCRDWFQLSLKEGLTVFRDQQFSSDIRSAAAQRISDVRVLRARQFPEDAGPLAHPVRPDSYIEINNFYTATVYDKGAEVIRMMHTMLGESGFRRGMDLYFERHDGDAVTCDDFVAAMEAANDVDLTQFRLWYAQAGTPTVHVDCAYDSDSKCATLTLDQSCSPTPGQPDKAPMVIPLALGLLDQDGAPIPLCLEGQSGPSGTTGILPLTERSHVYRFVAVESEPVLSINRGFAAPIRTVTSRSRADAALLMAHDTDPFNRWEAGQTLATELLIEGAESIQAGRAPTSDRRFVAALGLTLQDERIEKALLAQTMVLPTESYIAEQMDVADPDAIHRARQHLRRAIADALRDRLVSVYRENHGNAPYQPDAASAGRRALKNAALSYLALLDEDQDMQAIVTAQYRNANNMTDRMAALHALADMTSDARDQALADFYARYRDNPLVIDKWFTVQALSSRSDTLDAVKGLVGHEAFAITNPNRVRALIGAFVTGNPGRFHAADGAGYDFFAEQLLVLDPINAQVAARLLTALSRWQKLDPARQEKAKGALARILARPGLSRDVFEIASKSLAN